MPLEGLDLQGHRLGRYRSPLHALRSGGSVIPDTRATCALGQPRGQRYKVFASSGGVQSRGTPATRQAGSARANPIPASRRWPLRLPTPRTQGTPEGDPLGPESTTPHRFKTWAFPAALLLAYRSVHNRGGATPAHIRTGRPAILPRYGRVGHRTGARDKGCLRSFRRDTTPGTSALKAVFLRTDIAGRMGCVCVRGSRLSSRRVPISGPAAP